MLAVVRQSQKFHPATDPLLGYTGWPKLNQLEKITHYLYLQTQFGEDRCTQFRVIMVTDPQKTNSHKPTHRQDRLQYTAPHAAIARSVTKRKNNKEDKDKIDYWYISMVSASGKYKSKVT